MQAEPIATYTKDGQDDRYAYTPVDCINLHNDGWTEVEGSRVEPVTAPPRTGAGSGVKAWAEYAERNEVPVADDATREEIQDALTRAGVPTE